MKAAKKPPAVASPAPLVSTILPFGSGLTGNESSDLFPIATTVSWAPWVITTILSFSWLTFGRDAICWATDLASLD